ncbi:MAG: hypothetical protein D4Q79_00045 [Spirochaetia bacterium]|nr:MAG: hypothetical protein D4Q79_00045 [Spirochaetia bacterium]
MTFIIATIVIIIGVIIFSFTISNSILIIFFAIPFTKKLENISLLKSGNHIIRSYIIKLFIQIAIFFATTIFFYIYFLNDAFVSLMVGYAFGVIGIIIKIKEFSLNMNNFADYFGANKDYFWKELIVKYNEDRNKLLEFIVVALKEKNNHEN